MTADADGPIRVLLVDDDPLTRQALTTILGADPGIAVVGEAADGEAGLRAVTDLEPDVVLMDVRMPGTDGLTALERLARTRPDLAVVVLTTFADERYVARALAAGARGFLLKTGSPDELVNGVRGAALGGVVLSPRVGRWVVDRYGPSRRDPAEIARWQRLTPRQRDVARVLATGAANAEIARALHLSEGTVKGYVSDLMLALGVRNRVEAALLVHRLGELS